MKRAIWIIVIIGVLAGGFFAYRAYSSSRSAQAAQDNLQTVSLEEGTLAATIGATGTVRANQSANLIWQTSGTVDQVNVLLGDLVEKDQELSSLTQTSLAQNVILAQADLVNAQKALDDLLNSQVQSAQALQAVEKAEQALEDAQNPELAQARAVKAVADAQKLVETAERNLRIAQSNASQSSIDEAQANVTLAKDRLDRARDKYEPYANRPESNVTRATLLSELSAAQQQYDYAVRQLNNLLGTADETDLAVRQADLETAQAQLDEAQREWERIKDGTSSADLTLLEAQLADAQREWERVKDGPDPDDLAAAQARVAAAQATLDQAHIVAPFSGLITEVNSKPGDQVSPGTPAFRLDDLSHLWVDVEVSEVDINQVKTGQTAVLTFDAILAKEYQGEVVEVAPVGNEVLGVVNFKVTVELKDADQDVRPGMTSAVEIVVSQLDNAMLIPNQAVRVEEGKRVVYTMDENGQLTAIEVTLGASSDTFSQLLAGDLQPGDVIVLNPPIDFFSGGPPSGGFGGGGFGQ
ncbi:MAG: efflux RND transporter periplasmic adaptor subunit [Anaerolineales bacterium]|jgi:HlyD family secretion protein